MYFCNFIFILEYQNNYLCAFLVNVMWQEWFGEQKKG